MRDNFESKGLWILPNSEDEDISGTIFYTKEQGIILELLGSFGDTEQLFSASNNEIILGVLQNGKKVTLLNNAITSRTVNFPGIPTVKYMCSYMLVGGHFYSKSEIVFDEISIEYHNLSEWLNIDGIDQKEGSNKEFHLHYKLPAEIKFKINDYDARFEFFAQTKSADIENFSLIQKVEFSLKKQNTISIFDILRQSLIFQGFITFGSFQSCYPLRITLKNENSFEIHHKHKIYNEIELYYKSKVRKIQKSKKSFEFLFTYQDAQENFQEIINNWYKYDSEIEPIIYLFLNSFYTHDTIFSENKFLEIIHALETFHRRTYKNEVISKSEYSKKKKTILESVPLEYREWLQGKLNFGNEPSLHERLVELLSEIEEFTLLEEIITNKDEFIKNVKDSRNYYTHYDKRTEKKALKGSDLYYLTTKLRIVLIIHLLILLGIDKNKVASILQKLKDFHYNYLFR